jgi:hypothetical protein
MGVSVRGAHIKLTNAGFHYFSKNGERNLRMTHLDRMAGRPQGEANGPILPISGV